MKQKIFLIIGIVVLSIFGISIFQEFMVNHTYYQQMLGSRDNWKIIVRVLLSSMIPLWYIMKTKVFSLKRFFMRIIPISLILFSLAHTIIKEGIVGGSAGFIILCINTLLLYFLGMYFILGALALGTRVSDKVIKFKESRRQEMIINFGLGIGVLLLATYVLAMIKLFYGGITWILFLGLGALIWFMRKKLQGYLPMISSMFAGFSLHNLKHNRWKWVGLILLGLSFAYYFYGFQLSFIPYSTAWDANHAYMYIPKVLAENFGVLWGNVGPADAAPYLWHMFIAFRFSLIQPIKSRFWLSPDTIAVAMNFLSGIFVLIFGIGLVDQVLVFFGKKEQTEKSRELAFSFGWTGILFWLTSGMGAFLVFVDNKTDLGVMALTILAILSGFIFLKVIADSHARGEGHTKDSLKYIAVSGFLFALASMAKPTAFIDIALFGLLMLGLWIDVLLSIGLGVMTIGLMGILKVGNAADIMGAGPGKYVLLIGAIVAIIAIIRMLWKNYRHVRQEKKRYINYIVIWALICIATLAVFKGPNMLVQQINNGNLTISNWTRGLLLGKQTHTLLAATLTPELINEQTVVDQAAVTTQTSTLSFASCKQQSFSSGDLSKDLKTAVTSNEDVGRYVGYGWKDVQKGSGLSLGYHLVRVFYPINGLCYGVNHDAKLLCTNAANIDNFDVATLKILFAQVSKGGEAYNLLSGALAAYQAKIPNFSGLNISGLNNIKVNPTEFRDQIVALRQYYQDHAIKTEANVIHIPYRYLIPFNVVFNWSLQNLSSYYTDIGFVRLFMLIFVVAGFIYALVKKEKNLTVLSATTIIGRTIWWVIGGGIVWYGIGLIMWTILTVILFIKDMMEGNEDDNKKQNMLYIFFCLFALWAVVQFVLNFVRISSQGASGPFEWYKMSNGNITTITDQLQQTQSTQSKYGRKDVFDLQFPHYNKFIDFVKNRPNTDGVLIAGTYIQYFLQNQHNIKNDGMLDRFWEQNSDGNECKSYQRLRDNNLKYLVIDPNIGTVVQGEGNESLFNRFFAKLDPVTQKIQDPGAITMLVQLWKDGYINLFSTNNLGAKYAFTLSDQQLEAGFGTMSADDLLLLRGKLAIPRFFPEAQNLISFIADTFTNRLQDGSAIADIADTYGKTIDEGKILQVAVQLINQTDSEQVKPLIQALTQDEKLILVQYVGLVNLLKAENTQYQDYLNNLMQQSLGGGSQVMIFELN